MTTDNKIKLINSYLKSSSIVLDIALLNYETYNIYIRIDYKKKEKSCKLYWGDLDLIKDRKIEKYLNIENISYEEVDKICTEIEKQEVYEYINIKEKNKIIINAYLNNIYHYELNKYIPKKLSNLTQAFVIIFNNLPRKLEMFLYETNAEITNTKLNYDYNDLVEFDLFKGNLKNLANDKIIKESKQYKKDLLFLEKIENKYFAVINGINKYLIVIEYNKEKNETAFYCTCPCKFFCKHIIMVVNAIRDNYEKKFCKVLYNNTNNILESALISKYILSLGIEDGYMEIINKYGEIEQIPLVDSSNNVNFKVLEDTDDKTLYNEMKKAIKK